MCCFTAFLLVFFRIAITACFGFLLVPRAAFPPFVTVSLRACWGCSLLRLCFYLRRVCLALLLWLQVIAFMTRSNLRFPLRCGLPSASVFSVRVACLCCSPFLFVYTPFLCLVCSWRSLRVVFTRWVQLGFSWCSVSFGVGSFLVRLWFLPLRIAFTLLLLPLSSSVSGSLRIRDSRSAGVLVLPDIFFFFFHLIPSSLVGLVPLFLLPAVVLFLLRSFQAVSIFSFFSALPRVLCPLLLLRVLPWSLVSCFGFWPMCLTLGFANFMLPCGYPPGCFFGSFPPLPILVPEFSPLAWSPLVVRFCFFASLLPYFPGSSCCCLPLWVVRFLAFLSGTVIVRGSLCLYPLLPCVRSGGV